MINNEELLNMIQESEKAIKASETLKQDAMTRKSMWEASIKEKDAELTSLGTTPKKASSEIEAIDKSILENLKKIQSLIPMELLRKKGLI